MDNVHLLKRVVGAGVQHLVVCKAGVTEQGQRGLVVAGEQDTRQGHTHLTM